MTSSANAYRKALTGLAAFYGAVWILLAIRPISREDWVLENIMVCVGVLVLAISWRWYRFSFLSYLLVTLFLCFHAIGAHYTYSLVPYDDLFQRLSGRTLNSWFGWERNHYDRLVHFLYGLLLVYPYREAFLHFARVRWGFWSYLVPLCFILSSSLVYELLEWAAAIVFGGDLGIAFVGAQGDVWDAQRDSFAAVIGCSLATLIIGVVGILSGRDPGREWVEMQSADLSEED